MYLAILKLFCSKYIIYLPQKCGVYLIYLPQGINKSYKASFYEGALAE
jgi:hypothetical protein